MLSPDTISKFHKLAIPEATLKVAALAAVFDASPEELTKKYLEIRAAWEVSEKARLKREMQTAISKELHGKPVTLNVGNSGLMKALRFGVIVRLELDLNEDGEDILVLSAPVPGQTTASMKKDGLIVVGRGKSYNYFFDGQPITGAIAPYLRANFPESVASVALANYAAKDNKSKLGAWEAVQKDAELKARITREERVEA